MCIYLFHKHILYINDLGCSLRDEGVSFFLGVKKLIWWDVALAKK